MFEKQRPMSTPTAAFITFGDGLSRYRRAARRVTAEASASGLFSSCDGYSLRWLHNVHPDFCSTHGQLLRWNVRGFGYWVWKPLIVLDALRDSPAEFVVYLDSGCVLNTGPRAARRRMHEYFEIAAESGLLLMRTGLPERAYSKEDLLHAFELEDVDRDSDQLAAGALVLRRCDAARHLVREWLEVCTSDRYHLVDDSPSQRPNSADFVEHRHDQSVLSALCKLANISGLPDETYFPGRWESDGRESPIWMARHKWGAGFSPRGGAQVKLSTENVINMAEWSLRNRLGRSRPRLPPLVNHGASRDV